MASFKYYRGSTKQLLIQEKQEHKKSVLAGATGEELLERVSLLGKPQVKEGRLTSDDGDNKKIRSNSVDK